MQYYYLVAGLVEYPFDIDAVIAGSLQVDVPEIKAQILDGGLSGMDRRAVELLYTSFDIQNIVAEAKGGRYLFNVLGNLTQEQVTQLVKGDLEAAFSNEDQTMQLPQELCSVIARFRGLETDDEQQAIQTPEELETALWTVYYTLLSSKGGGWLARLCGAKRYTIPTFLERWAAYDRQTRNLTAAYMGKRLGVSEENRRGMVVEADEELRDALVGGQGNDFGVSDQFPYAADVLAVLEIEDFVERERKMDQLRVQMADDLAENDYFGIGRILNYLIRLNALHRWASLDSQRGREQFQMLVEGLTDTEKIAAHVAAQQAAQA